MSVKTGKYYLHKKETAKPKYDDAFEKCVVDTCQYCIDNSGAHEDAKLIHPIMMLGKIQSGKTRAFTAVIAMAFDNDFDVILILTKNSTALVSQTVLRMIKEFKNFSEIDIQDIININNNISPYALKNKKFIIVAKKEKRNLVRIGDFIEDYSIDENKKCLIIDDEADVTGIGYSKVKNSDEFDLRTVAKAVNRIRGNLNNCVFVQVTATPYALFLQPEFTQPSEPKPVKPLKTILVPSGEGYIGGEYYFIKNREPDSLARFLFDPVSDEEHALVSAQRNKGKKAGTIKDRRSVDMDGLLKNENIPIFKKGLINFMVGALALRMIHADKTLHYAYVIHTATQKATHDALQEAAEHFLDQMRLALQENGEMKDVVEVLFALGYEDIKKSVEAYSFKMPEYDLLWKEFCSAFDTPDYFISIVNSDKDVPGLLNPETGELRLDAPFSIFVGGGTLDRGVTIPNLIGFYYGRSPKTMQQDTVLQHSRMFGYRGKDLMAVTRFYTTNRIHRNMEKITEIDMDLREDIEAGRQGEGLYFINSLPGDEKDGRIVPCGLDKIKVSDIVCLKPHKRILPVGFMPDVKAKAKSVDLAIQKILDKYGVSEDSDNGAVPVEVIKDLVERAYSILIPDDDDAPRFVKLNTFLTALDYVLGSRTSVSLIIRKGRTLSKYRTSGGERVLSDAPDTPDPYKTALKIAGEDTPVVMLIQQSGEAEGWEKRPFWWPILVTPINTKRAICAEPTPKEKIRAQN
jgi:hypothetical protein